MTVQAQVDAAALNGVEMLRRALRDLEMQAQALFSANERIRDLTQHLPLATIAPEGFGALRRRPAYVQQTLPSAARARWAHSVPDAPPGHAALRAYPGHGAASIQLKPHITTGYVIDEKDPARIAMLVRSVYLAQRSRKNFSPIFITTSPYFAPFLQHGYVFEYLQPYTKSFGDLEVYDEWRRQRLEFLTAKWGIAHLIEYRGQAFAGQGFYESHQTPKLVVYPDYSNRNPYIKMMYAKVLQDFAVSFGSAADAARLAQRDHVVFHLHWEDAVFRTMRDDIVPEVMADFVLSIDRLRNLGGKFVWTIHNFEPHDVVDPELSHAFSRELLKRADRIHVHDAGVARKIRDAVTSSVPVVVIEHPSYAGAYPDRADRGSARDALDLSQDDAVFLCFGEVRRYKGIEHLLNVAPQFRDRATFIIAGRSGRYDPRGALPANCISFEGEIDDEKLIALYSAADFAVLPFEQVTTSGSLLLALSLGVPVIAPAHEAITGLVRDGAEGILYSPNEPGGLANAIERALKVPTWTRDAMGQSARAAAAFRPAEAFAESVRSMLLDLIQAPDRGVERETHDQPSIGETPPVTAAASDPSGKVHPLPRRKRTREPAMRPASRSAG